MRFEVPLLFRGQDNFISEDPAVTTPEQAADAAWRRFKDGQAPDILGNEWQEPVRVGTVKRLDGDHEEECHLDESKLEEAVVQPDDRPAVP